ncbi:MAG TPA: type IV toxin-antitoxin system AbiEi family antitoxin [Candidatus Limnocylindria bacterium]|nr:type IV toxin-antitoxin system AbiEi family antitoxin [Candidatus Limnocylindria bacterium]
MGNEQDALMRLRSVLPPQWTLERQAGGGARAQTELDLIAVVAAPDGVSTLVAIELKSGAPQPRALSELLTRLAGSGRRAATVVIADYLSPASREVLRRAGIGYVDATGNAELVLARPGLAISRAGATTNPLPEARAVRSLKGAAAARIVRALCDLRPPLGVRALAVQARASAGYVSKLLRFLESQDLVTRAPGRRGAVAQVAWRRLIARWAEGYDFTRTNQVLTFLEPRSLPALLTRLAVASPGAAVTGSFVAAEVAPVVSPRLLSVYVDDPVSAAAALGLRAADAGANVTLARPFDPVVYERGWTGTPFPSAALSQVAADLLTSGGRGPNEAEALLDWMERNEDAWRR